MSTISNEHIALPLVSSPVIRLVPSSSPAIRLVPSTSPEIRLTVHKPSGTPTPRKLGSLTVLSIPRDSKIGGWTLKTVMLVQIRQTRRESLATTWLEGVAEYGTGKQNEEAITDLVVSVGEYWESLEKREKELGDSARKELDFLRRLIKRSPDESA